MGQYKIIASAGKTGKDSLKGPGPVWNATGTNPSDTTIRKFREQLERNRLPYNGMPNAITQKYPPDIYIGNNGMGQDIYRAQLDNMPILKPDSSFSSSMPKKMTTPAPSMPVWRGQPRPPAGLQKN